MKKIRKLCMLAVCAVVFCACSRSSSEQSSIVQEHAEEVEDAFESVDMERINEIFFHDKGNAFDSQLIDGYGFEQDSGEMGALESVFSRVSVKVISANQGTLTYLVHAPDMSTFFEDTMENASEMEQKEFQEYFYQYVEKASIVEREVSLPYKMEAGQMSVSYQRAEFLDAITGGLIESYGRLYAQMIEEYKNSMEGE